jgi:hypothetical protein
MPSLHPTEFYFFPHFEDITHRAARNRFAFHGITSEDDFGF